MEKIHKIPAVKDGETFIVAGIEFIKFPEVNGTVPAVAKKCLFRSEFGENNDFRCSNVLNRLANEVFPLIAEAVGEENICTVHADLTTLDGLKTYGVMESKVSLPTLDFYRENVDIFDKYKVNAWWWLATAESAQPHDDPNWITCVAPSGCVNGGYYDIDCGVRPFLSFNSSIFESSEN